MENEKIRVNGKAKDALRTSRQRKKHKASSPDTGPTPHLWQIILSLGPQSTLCEPNFEARGPRDLEPEDGSWRHRGRLEGARHAKLAVLALNLYMYM